MLKCLPCSDSAEMAAARCQELDIPRTAAIALGQSAVLAAKNGHYQNRRGQQVDWGHMVNAACLAKQSIPPDKELPAHQRLAVSETTVQVTNETTLGAALSMVQRGLRPLALNFANGIHPGGGFLTGSRAQEEVLCRSSALWSTLDGDPMYQAHAERSLPDSSDWAIYSPDVPIFRKDSGEEIDQPWLLSFLTCAAPYAPTVGREASAPLLQKRISRVLRIAEALGHSSLVLGAWGCGAFGNDPLRTAQDFRQELEGEFDGAFAEVVFAIADWSPVRRFLGPFREVFSPKQ